MALWGNGEYIVNDTGSLDTNIKTNESFLLHTVHKNQSSMECKLMWKAIKISLLEGSIGKYLHDLQVGKDFSNWLQKQ